jgi:ABC-type transport system substrate-binding protein
LSGTMGSTVSTVIINWYQLKEYKAGNKKFSYRVSLEDGTLKEGKNTYLLEGKVGDTATITGEVLTVYYTPDTAKLAEYKKTIDDEYIARNNTPALIAEREREKQSKKESALALDPKYYHDKAGTPFRVKIAYVSGPQSTELYALAIQKPLENLSIMTELVALDPKALQSMIVSGKKDYDILIAWVSAGGTIAGIGQLFASSEAKKWVNFSNIESERLDTLFVELRSATTWEKIEKITNDIIEIMNSESFFFPISSPIHTLYVDRNLKWIRNMSLIPGPTAIYDVLEFASIKDAYVFKTAWKNPFRFLVWLWDILVWRESNPSPNLP